MTIVIGLACQKKGGIIFINPNAMCSVGVELIVISKYKNHHLLVS